MALDLNVPIPQDRAGLPEEAVLQSVQGVLAGLSFGKPAAAAQSVLASLHALNRRNAAGEARFKLMELYRPAVLRIGQGRAPQYYNAALPLSDKAAEAAQLARLLFTELAYGYKLALLGRSSGFFGGNKLLPAMIQRAMDALSQLLMVSYQTYGAVPKNVWRELHQLHGFAAQQKLLDTEVVGTEGRADASISLVYKQALMLFLAEPRHLAAGDIDRVREYLVRHAGLVRLQPLSPQADAAGAFLVRPNADEPPTAFVRRKGADSQADMLLVTAELTALLAAQMERLQANEAPAKLQLPPIALDPHYQDLLAHMHRYWAHAPKRVFSRSARQDTTQVCVGLLNVHYFLNAEARYVPPPTASTGVTEITLGKGAASVSQEQATGLSARWRVVNESAGGAALAKLPDTPASLRLGELLGIRADQGKSWGLGVVRWASTGEHGELDIGVQMIAPGAMPVAVRIEGGPRFQLALLLPEIAALKQPSTLLMTPGTYEPARLLELDQHGKATRLMATKLIERTTCFERFQFSYL